MGGTISGQGHSGVLISPTPSLYIPKSSFLSLLLSILSLCLFIRKRPTPVPGPHRWH